MSFDLDAKLCADIVQLCEEFVIELGPEKRVAVHCERRLSWISNINPRGYAHFQVSMLSSPGIPCPQGFQRFLDKESVYNERAFKMENTLEIEVLVMSNEVG